MVRGESIELNARLQPMHRIEMLEEPSESTLSQAKAGKLFGGEAVLPNEKEGS